MSQGASAPPTGSEIAIIGMSGRFPGCPDIERFWEALRDGKECLSRFTEQELRDAGVEERLLKDPAYVRAGGRLEEMDSFDAPFFGYSPKDAGIMDPQHRCFLEGAWAALENAGHTSGGFPGSIGVFAGCGMNAYFMNNVLSNRELVDSVGMFLLRHTGNDRDFLPTTVSYKLNLRGPSIAVQTACSTSLVAVHMACQSLLSGECDIALAGGITILIPHAQGYLYRPNEIHSPDGHCRPFDAGAAGTVISSGMGVVVLRRLKEAREDGDFIHAVIRGSAVNNDGSGKVGYLAPSVDGHARVVAEALALADLKADQISYLEAHGTGTAVGDPIEIAALTQAFRKTTNRTSFCPIGSVKSNIGHLDTAAGVAGLIKVVESMKHDELPASLNYRSPNPAIDFENSPFIVNEKLTPWPKGMEPRRAGISSLGVGGTNAHVVLEEDRPPERSGSSSTREIICLSAKTPSALDAATENLAVHLRNHPEANLGDVAFTLQSGREAFEYRRIAVASDAPNAAAELESGDGRRIFSARAARTKPSIVFMFPGGGAQYPGMGKGLYDTQPTYRTALDECLSLLRPRVDFDLAGLMMPGPGGEEAAARGLEDPQASVCAVFSVEYALSKLLMSWGVVPDALTGHSLGEYVAACLAGVFSLSDVLPLVALRGKLVGAVRDGAMLSIPLPEEEISKVLGPDLDLAAVNGPSFCVVSGKVDRLKELEATLKERDLECRRLPLAGASHTRLLEPMMNEFRRALSACRLGPPRVPYVSNVTGTWVRPQDAQDPEYWVRHFRQTVRFSQGLSRLLEAPDRILLEVGPGQTLGSLARQQPVKPVAVLSSMRRPEETAHDEGQLLTAVGRLWTSGGAVEWSRLRQGPRRRRVPLPTYPFERKRYWIKERERLARGEPGEAELLKSRSLDDWFYGIGWKPAEPPRSAAEYGSSSGPTLLFMDPAGLGERLARRLRERGETVVTVREGDALTPLGDQDYALAPESGREGYAHLLQELADRKLLPHRIVHLWMITPEEPARRAASFYFHRKLERGFYSLLFLAQAFAERDPGAPLALTVVSNGMQSVQGEPLPFPEKALTLGPVKVIPREFPGFTCRSVDILLPEETTGVLGLGTDRDPLESLADRLLAELGPHEGEPVIALRGDMRWEQTHEKTPLPPREGGGSLLRTGGTYLVTGGLGGIGLEVAEHLARSSKARLVLIGRTPLPPRQEWDTWLTTHAEGERVSRILRRLLRIESEGGQVLALSADVSDLDGMKAVLAKVHDRFGPIHGTFHAAGGLEEGVIPTKMMDSVERVFSSKVYGTQVLSELLAGEPLDFLVLFASTSSVLGPPGQVDYVAANCFLNAFARSRTSGSPARTISVNWGVWKDVGMAAGISRRLRGAEPEQVVARERAGHALLGDRIRRDARDIVFEARLSPMDHWILDEHRMRGGPAIVPGTAYLEIARAAMEDVTRAPGIDIRDLSILAPLSVGNDERRSIRTVLVPQDGGYDFEVRSRAGENGDGTDGWDLHVKGTLRPDAAESGKRLDLREIESRCTRRVVPEGDAEGAPVRLRQERHLSLGPRWKGIRRLRFGRNEAVAELRLPQEYRSDLAEYKLHPAVLDLATGFALDLIEGYETVDALYVPMSYRSVRVHGPLPERIYSHVRSSDRNGAERDVATFDVALTDEDGRVLVEVDQFAMKKVESPARFGSTDRGDEVSNPDPGARPPLSPGERLFLAAYDQGIEPGEGMRALDLILGASAPPQVIVSPVDFPSLLDRTRALAAGAPDAGVRFARPELKSSYQGPRNELERVLAGFWEDLLGVDKIGIHDDFFELGGHSLIAVRLFAKIRREWGLEYPISMLFQGPTVARCAEKISADLAEAGRPGPEPKGGADRGAGSPKRRYLVPLNVTEGDDRTPFFFVGGMYGNVLNLRHLAAHLGDLQPVYALQARGLLGDDRPHTRFEEMARDYLEEVRSVQPHGPYLLGGFSGGGITALEMAQQLKDAGEETALLVMLDSFPPDMPKLTWGDRVKMKAQSFRRHGISYLGSWMCKRFLWEAGRFRRLFRKPVMPESPVQFRSERIQAAFREAVANYRPRPYPGDVLLFRPPMDETHVLGPGRIVNSRRTFENPSNFWTPHIAGGIEAHLVPGDHLGMVLEPHVRSIARRIRDRLKELKSRTAPGAAR